MQLDLAPSQETEKIQKRREGKRTHPVSSQGEPLDLPPLPAPALWLLRFTCFLSPPSSPPLFLLSAFHFILLWAGQAGACTCTPTLGASYTRPRAVLICSVPGHTPLGRGTQGLGWRLQKSEALLVCWQLPVLLCLVIAPPTQEVWWHRAPWLGHLCHWRGNSRLASPGCSGASEGVGILAPRPSQLTFQIISSLPT